MNKISASCLLVLILIMSGCSPSEQRLLETQAIQAGKTALAVGKTQAPPLQTQAARLAKTVVVVAKTESPPLQTEAVKLAKTALVAAKTESPPLQTQAAYLVQTAIVIGKTESPPLQTRVAHLAQTAIVQGGEVAGTQAIYVEQTTLAQIATELANPGQQIPQSTPVPPEATSLPPDHCKITPGQVVVQWMDVLDPCQFSMFGFCLWPLANRAHPTYKVTVPDAVPLRQGGRVIAALDGVKQEDWITWDSLAWNTVDHTNIDGFEPISENEYIVQPAGTLSITGPLTGHLGLCMMP
jgi:hypothetical protein